MSTEEPRNMPATKSKAEVVKIYAKLSRMYDAWGVLTEARAAERALQLAAIKDGEDILEVAVGTGRVFEQIVSANKTGRNEGIDLSPEMLAVAEKRLSRKFSNYSLKVADAYSLPYEEASFDVVVCNYMFDLLPTEDFPVVLLEFKRVLRPGGRIALTSWTRARHWYSRIWDWLIGAAPDLMAGCRPVFLRAAVEQAGFVEIQQEYVTQLTFPSVVIRAEKP